MSIKTIWSHYGEDCTGEGRSELELLAALEGDLGAGRIEDARSKVASLRSLSQSYGYGEADGFLSDNHDGATDEGMAYISSYENIWETDYATTIDATEAHLSRMASNRLAQGVVTDALSAMRDGYEAGRKMREHESTPKMSM